jgi:regulator of protease activity HflC (stomatin/prohibitin superfamily)
MKKTLLFAALTFPMFFAGCGCNTVEPGYVGVKVPYYGDAKNQDYQLVRGVVWYNGFTERIYEFPTFLQSVVWTKDTNEGSPTDESVTFNSAEGEGVNVDVAFSYTIPEDKVSDIFKKQRKEIRELTHIFLRSEVRDSIVLHGSRYKIIPLIGLDKEKLITEVKADLIKKLGPQGYEINAISFVGKMRVDPKVEASISATITQLSKTVEAENKIKQSEAEARQSVAVAKGKADAEVQEAEGKAKARVTIAEAEAKANTLVQKSLTPEVLEFNMLKQWDGKLPQVMGGGVSPFVNLKDLK